MDAVSFTYARANLEAVIDRVVTDKAPTAITRRGGESVVMIAEREWASIEETLKRSRY